jgi:hypothetical protein
MVSLHGRQMTSSERLSRKTSPLQDTCTGSFHLISFGLVPDYRPPGTKDILDNTGCCVVDIRGKVTRLVKVSNRCASLVNIASALVLKLLFDLHPKATLPDIKVRIFVNSSTFPASHHVSTLISQG